MISSCITYSPTLSTCLLNKVELNVPTNLLNPMPQSASFGIMVDAHQRLVDTDTAVTTVLAGTKRKPVVSTNWETAPNDPNEQRWKIPCWLRGYLWSENEISKTPSATVTETTEPMLKVPLSELSSPIPNEMIAKNPHLFKIMTAIKVDHFEKLLSTHPNCPLIESLSWTL